MRIKTRKNSH